MAVCAVVGGTTLETGAAFGPVGVCVVGADDIAIAAVSGACVVDADGIAIAVAPGAGVAAAGVSVEFTRVGEAVSAGLAVGLPCPVLPLACVAGCSGGATDAPGGVVEGRAVAGKVTVGVPSFVVG
jgi:hypothetical protein